MVGYEKININKLKPAGYNPRIMNNDDLQKLEKNMKEFGLVDPIIINLNNMHIIGGHQRYTILKKDPEIKELNIIKLGDIGWAFPNADLKLENETKEKMLNLSLNKFDGQFDETKLNNLFDELTESGVDIEITGFNDYEIMDIQLNNIDLDLLDDAPPTMEPVKKVVEKKAPEMYINIKLYNETQKQKLTKLIQILKEKNPDKSISNLLYEFVQNNITQHKKITPYTLLFDDEATFNQFKKLQKELEKEYKSDSFINFIDEHAK